MCFALKKLKEQVSSKTYKRLLIDADRPLLDAAGMTTYLETTRIEHGARLHDIFERSGSILELHNTTFQELENGASSQGVGYGLETVNGGFLNISGEIECLYIRGKDFHSVIPNKEHYEEFARNNQFDLYSSREFARECADILNVITAFYSEEQILHMGKKILQQSSTHITHHLMEIEEQYLSTLYSKTKNDPEAGADPRAIAQAIGLNTADLPAFQYQLQEAGYIRKHKDGRRISITGSGMRIAKEILQCYQATIVTVTNGHPVPMGSRMLYSYLYFYRLSTQDPGENNKSIMIGISDFVQRRWTLSFQPGGSAEGILLLYARDVLIEKIQAGTLTDDEKFEIMIKDLDHLPPYAAPDGIPMKGAEFFIYKKIKERPSVSSAHHIPDIIVQIRQAINILFKKKHKDELLSFTQEENLSDLFKDAHTKEEFNTRVTSLGSTAGEMNIDLLRNLTGITDTQIRSIQLLKALLMPLDPTVEPHIKIFQNLASIRNGYPAHKDKPDTLKAYAALGITYPVTDFSGSWKSLLSQYLTALQGIKEVIELHFT
ncbi:MAG TPA: hypothetical protein VNS58_08305 [Puia sp.]|nr:hypothetical protein [Puia sp.]